MVLQTVHHWLTTTVSSLSTCAMPWSLQGMCRVSHILVALPMNVHSPYSFCCQKMNNMSLFFFWHLHVTVFNVTVSIRHLMHAAVSFVVMWHARLPSIDGLWMSMLWSEQYLVTHTMILQSCHHFVHARLWFISFWIYIICTHQLCVSRWHNVEVQMYSCSTMDLFQKLSNFLTFCVFLFMTQCFRCLVSAPLYFKNYLKAHWIVYEWDQISF